MDRGRQVPARITYKGAIADLIGSRFTGTSAFEEGLRQRAKEFAGAEIELYVRLCEQSDY